MKATLIQTHLIWEDREKNLSHFDTLINSIDEQTDLIVLPEMFTTGFSMCPEKIAEPANGATLTWLKQKAFEKKAVITGSVAIKKNGKYYNRLYWVEPNGNVQTYDKRHLFRMAKEDEYYTGGDKKIITQINEWKICPLICYDLRFPVWSRNKFQAGFTTKTLSALRNNKAEGSQQSAGGSQQSAAGSDQAAGAWDYDVLIYVANWPEVRSYAWKQLLIARAIENQCYVIGLNRIGRDGHNYAHSGDSVMINPRGEVISKTRANEESIETVLLDKNYLEEYRKIFPVGLDADKFELLPSIF